MGECDHKARGMTLRIEDFKSTQSGPVSILGNGPSLDSHPFDHLLLYPTIGINRSWRKIRSTWYVMPPTDCYYKDIAWRKWTPVYVFVPGRLENCKDRIRYYTRFYKGEKPVNTDNMFVTINTDKGRRDPPKTEVFPDISFTLSGILALELAVYMGFNPIHLLAFDGGAHGHFPTGDGREHITSGTDHDKHHAAVKRKLDPGIEVYNCNPHSDIKTWPYKPIVRGW